MFKESVICIIIVAVIFSLDMFTQDYTNKTTLEITKIFSDLKEQILKEDKELRQAQQHADDLRSKRKKISRHNKLAYYIEHDELEKIDTAIISAKTYIETEDYSSAATELDVGKFVLEHIQRKYAFNLVNVF